MNQEELYKEMWEASKNLLDLSEKRCENAMNASLTHLKTLTYYIEDNKTLRHINEEFSMRIIELERELLDIKSNCV